MHKRWTLIGLLGITFLAFSLSLFNDFTNWDDGPHLTENPYVRSLDPSNLKKIFAHTVLGTYIPLTVLSFALEYHFFGLDPFVYHLNNLLLHLAVTCLVFYFGLQMGLTRQAAFLATLLFGVHPMRVESVAWVTGRKDVLYALFYLIALLVYVRYLKGRKYSVYLLTLFLGLSSILAKPMALSLPLIFFVLDWWHHRKWDHRALLDKIPHFLYILPLVWITYANYMRLPGQNVLEAILIWIWTFMFYLQKFLFPIVLVPLYQWPEPISLGNPAYLSSLILMLVLILILVRLQKHRWVRLAIVFYFFSVFFLLRFDVVADKHVVADRYIYLPSLGFCFLLGWWMDERLRRFQIQAGWLRRFLLAGLVLLFVILAVKTFLQGRIWQSSLTLWTYVIQKSPNKAVAYQNRGAAYLEKDQLAEALKDFDQAVRLNPRYADCFYNRGIVYKRLKQFDEAIRDFTQALGLRPYFAEAFNNRGAVYKIQGRYDLAMGDFHQAIHINSNLEEAYINRAAVYVLKKQYDQAASDLTQAILINPTSPETYLKRGAVYQLLNQSELARDDFLHAQNLPME